MSTANPTMTMLSTLKLRGVVRHYEHLLDTANADTISYADFLETVLQAELTDRSDRRVRRTLAGAHFPVEKTLEAFELDRVTGISAAQLANLVDFRWIDKHENLIFLGPPGIGKTHLSIALGLRAIQSGYTVCFERMSTLVRLLSTAPVQRSSTFRVARVLKADLLVIDEIGYTPIDRKEANLFFNLVSEVYERSSIIVTSNKGFEEWVEMLGDPVMTTALLDRLLHHAQLFSLSGDSYRMQNRNKEE